MILGLLTSTGSGLWAAKVSAAGLSSPLYMLHRGLYLYLNENPVEARAWFEKYLQKAPDHEVPLRYLAQIEMRSGRTSQAEKYLKRAIATDEKAYESLLLLGELKLKTGKTAEAITAYEQILEHDRFHEKAISVLAYIYGHQKDDRKAASYYKRLILAVKKNSGNRALLYQSYGNLGNYYYKQGNYDRAVSYYEKQVELAPGDTRSLLVLGELYKMSGNFEQSIETINRLLKSAPDYKPALESVIESRYILNQRAVLRQAIDYQNKYGKKNVLINAIVKELQNMNKAAIVDFESVLKKNRSRISAHIGLARIYKKDQNHGALKREAFTVVVLSQRIRAYRISAEYITPVFKELNRQAHISDFQKRFFYNEKEAGHITGTDIERLARDYSEAYSTHGVTREGLEDNNSAAAHYRESIRYMQRLLEHYDKSKKKSDARQNAKIKRVERKIYDTFLSLSWLYTEKKWRNYPRSLKYLSEAQRIYPDKHNSYFMAGVIYNEMGAENKKYYYKAEDALQNSLIRARAANLDPSPNYYFYLGMVTEKTRGFTHAEKYLKKAVELEPYNSTYLNYLGYMYSQQGSELEKAKKYLLRALEDDPENEAYLDSYGWILFKMGRYHDALTQLVQASNQALKNKRDDPVIFYHLAETYYQLKDDSMAHYYYTKTLKYIEKASEPLDQKHINKRLKELEKKTDSKKR